MSFKKAMDKIAQDMVDSLNRNVARDHIENVELGLSPKDEDYIRFKKIEKHLKSLEAYQKWLKKNGKTNLGE